MCVCVCVGMLIVAGTQVFVYACACFVRGAFGEERWCLGVFYEGEEGDSFCFFQAVGKVFVHEASPDNSFRLFQI